MPTNLLPFAAAADSAHDFFPVTVVATIGLLHNLAMLARIAVSRRRR
jgi:hypothetical protein